MGQKTGKLIVKCLDSESKLFAVELILERLMLVRCGVAKSGGSV